MFKSNRAQTLAPFLLLCCSAPVLGQDAAPYDPLDECTNFLVTRGASATGSVSICYTCDAPFASRLAWVPGGDHEPGSLVALPESRARGEVRQVASTYAVLASNGIGHMNEHQLAIGETTFGGRRGLNDSVGLHYADLMTLALQRARTAREAIGVIAELASEYGYTQSGESISIGDPEEAWIMEIMGNGPDKKGIVWVAVRVPDGHVSAHANQARIGEFPLDDPENCLYSDDVIQFAVDQGFYDPASGAPFNFSDAYHPPSLRTKKACAMRVWSMLSRVAPELDLSSDYHRGVDGAERYPLSVRPAKKLVVSDVFALLRDHYEGTEFDMAECDEAGKFSSPYVARTERAISIPGTSFSIVTQSRSHLPDPIGGVVWYSPDDTFFSCYTPLYCGTRAVPEAYSKGDRKAFDWDSAWWAFNFVANQAYPRYSILKTPIQTLQAELETDFMTRQPEFEARVEKRFGQDPTAAAELLTEYTVASGDSVAKRWRALGEQLIVQYNDGRNGASRRRAQQQPKSVALFNGEDLSGWHSDVPKADGGAEVPPSFVVRDGILVSQGNPQGHLITDGSFKNYRLTVEYRWPSKPGNCGILVHASTPRRLYGMFPQSIECQMHVGNAGDFWCIGEDIAVPDMELRRGPKDRWGVDEGLARRIKNLTDDSEHPQGEWNEMIIECRGSAIEVWVNGDKTNHGTDCTANEGQIAIQAEGAPCELRKVELVQLTGAGK